MNKENVQAALDDLKVRQDLFLISKLEKEYNELSDKCNKLYTYIYSLDFITKVPDCNERCLMQEQHKRMESYRTNLYQRIDFYRDRVKIACGYDILMSWSVVAERIRQFGVPIVPAKIERTIETPCGPVHLVNQDKASKEELESILHHCDKDWDELVNNNYKNYCRHVLEEFLNREITWGDYLEKMRLPFCGENLMEFVKAGSKHDECHHCGQDATCQVDDGIAAVKDPVVTCESLYKLLGYQVICFLKPGESRCEQCQFNPNDPEDCVKVELVGGYYLCLAPLHNSIVTE